MFGWLRDIDSVSLYSCRDLSLAQLGLLGCTPGVLCHCLRVVSLHVVGGSPGLFLS